MASETVIAHNVIISGLAPAHGLGRRGLPRPRNVFGKGADEMHITGDLSLADFALIEKNDGAATRSSPTTSTATYPGTKFITVGEKSYAVESATGATGDIAVRMSSRRSNVTSDQPTGCRNLSIPGVPGNGQWRSPAGKNVPAYLTGPTPMTRRCAAATSSTPTSNNYYGTKAAFPSWLYPRMAIASSRAPIPTHLGGDTWVADAAIEMMQQENWSGMFVTMGGIDKAAHMWGAQDDNDPQDCCTLAGMTHTPCAAENADVQLGKILDEGRSRSTPQGRQDPGRADRRPRRDVRRELPRQDDPRRQQHQLVLRPADLGVWDAGTDGVLDKVTYSNPSPAIAPLIADGNMQFSYQSTAIEAWLIDHSTAAKKTQGRRTMLATARRDCHVLEATRRVTPYALHGHQRDDQFGEGMVEGARPGDRRHDGGRQRSRRRSGCCTTRRATASTATTAARRRPSSACRWCSLDPA